VEGLMVADLVNIEMLGIMWVDSRQIRSQTSIRRNLEDFEKSVANRPTVAILLNIVRKLRKNEELKPVATRFVLFSLMFRHSIMANSYPLPIPTL
jgi:hypothetical protein